MVQEKEKIKIEDITNRKTLTINEVMAITRVSRRTVYNWMHDGKIEFICVPSGKRRIFADSVWHGYKASNKEHKDGCIRIEDLIDGTH